jgi:hypothetical protein
LFISEIFHLIFSVGSGLWLTKTVESDTVDIRGLPESSYPKTVFHERFQGILRYNQVDLISYYILVRPGETNIKTFYDSF